VITESFYKKGVKFCTVFKKRMLLRGAEITQQRPAESMVGETSEPCEARPERTETTEQRERNRNRTAETSQQQQACLEQDCYTLLALELEPQEVFTSMLRMDRPRT
jgi:hypothetical protein